jgi:hypothetical protein
MCEEYEYEKITFITDPNLGSVTYRFTGWDSEGNGTVIGSYKIPNDPTVRNQFHQWIIRVFGDIEQKWD